jgi:hypothetical protein
MVMKLLTISLFAFLAQIAWAAEGPLAFKDLELGASEESVRIKYPKLNCKGEQARRVCSQLVNEREHKRLVGACVARGGSIGGCRREAHEVLGIETVAGVPISFMSFRFHDEKLGLIALTTPSAEFDKVAEAFITRYGKPTKDEKSPFTTKGGQTYENHEMQWLSSAGIIRLKRLSGHIDRSSVMYISPEAARTFGADVEQARKKAASDL